MDQKKLLGMQHRDVETENMQKIRWSNVYLMRASKRETK